jgi:excisionase family DNA binding protein
MPERFGSRALTVKAIAERYGFDVRTVYGWIKKGELIALKLPGGDYRVMPEDLADFHRRWRGRNSESPTIASDSEAATGSSPGPTLTVVAAGPFQRGRQNARRR